MEEDIKLLKEMKQNCLTKREYIDTKAERKAQAIENALNRLAELEKENAELKAMLKNRIRYTQELEQDLFENARNYVVPKSVIREKIEAYKKYGLKRNIGSFIDMSTYKSITYEQALEELKEELIGE